jgi:polyribonucleotide nucleotidyltransferase
MGAKDGLVHISELADQRVAQTTDVVNEGDQVKVVVLGMDDRGKVKLSMKRVNQENGEIIGDLPDPSEVSAPRPRREGGDRDRGRDRGPRREGSGRR